MKRPIKKQVTPGRTTCAEPQPKREGRVGWGWGGEVTGKMIDRRKQKRKRTRKSIAKTEKKAKAPAMGGKDHQQNTKIKTTNKKTGQKSRNCKKERTADQKTKDI